MDYVTLNITQETLEKMEIFYKEDLVFDVGEYILWKTKTIDDVVITIYSSKKGLKAVFSGANALNEALIWDVNATINPKKEKIDYYWLDVNNIIEFNVSEDSESSDLWLIKSIDTDFSTSGTQTINAMRYYPMYADISLENLATQE